LVFKPGNTHQIPRHRRLIWFSEKECHLFPSDALVVVHFGDAILKFDNAMISTPYFLSSTGNTSTGSCTNYALYVDLYNECSLREDNHQAVRARWYHPTLTTTFSSTKATCFHRWLVSTSPETLVEHLNDIALSIAERPISK
jgi:hypothetical protein